MGRVGSGGELDKGVFAARCLGLNAEWIMNVSTEVLHSV